MSALLCFRPKKGARVRLVAFPWAGASAAVLRSLSDALKDSDVEVHAVAYAGRAHRRPVPLPASIDDVVADVLPSIEALDGPVAVYGHSFGAVAAFCAVVAAQRDVVHVVIAARAAACVDVSANANNANSASSAVDALDDDGLVEELTARGLIDRALFGDPEARALLLPPLRRDLSISARTRREEVIDAPITTLRGSNDTSVTAADIARWREHTRGPFATHVVDGDHLFVRDNAPATALLLRRILTP